MPASPTTTDPNAPDSQHMALLKAIAQAGDQGRQAAQQAQAQNAQNQKGAVNAALGQTMPAGTPGAIAPIKGASPGDAYSQQLAGIASAPETAVTAGDAYTNQANAAYS